MYEEEIDHSFLFYRDLKKEYPVIVSGKGVYLYDQEGRRYLDACSGALVSNIGHGVEEVAKVLAGQARAVAFAHLSQFSNAPALGLARRVAEMAPGDLNRVYFVSGGSEATEAALKLARQYFLERDGTSSKWKVIARWHSFHGNTLGALSMSGHVPRRRRYAPLLLDFPHIPPAYCYRCWFDKTYPECDLACARELERVIKAEGKENVAAFIAEPIVGAAAGALVPPPEYFQVVRDICTRHDVLFIADEVMTGFGRTGKNFAIDHWQVVPDIMCVAKGMGAGYAPLGAIVVSEEIHDRLQRGSGRFVHGHTYGANPLSCAAGCAVIDYVRAHDLVGRAREMGEYLLSKLDHMRDIPIVGDIRGRGLMVGIELVRDRETREPFPPSMRLADTVARTALAHGLVLYPGTGAVDGEAGDHFLIGPPLVIQAHEIDELVAILSVVLQEVAARILEGRGSGP